MKQDKGRKKVLYFFFSLNSNIDLPFKYHLRIDDAKNVKSLFFQIKIKLKAINIPFGR